MKPIIKQLLTAILVLSTVLSLAACGDYDLGSVSDGIGSSITNTGSSGTGSSNASNSNIESSSEHVHVEEIIPAVYATAFSTGMTEGIRCSECGEILKKPEETPTVDPVEISFPAGSVTQEPTVISTEHFRFEIPENVYILDDFAEKVDLLCAVMEEVSGLKFDANPHYSENLIQAEVLKLTDTESEMGPAYASYGSITVSSGDLVDFYALIHEGSHALHYSQSPWFYCTWAMEGISTYTTYKTQKYIQENYPELTSLVQTVNVSILNMGVSNFDELFGYPMEYWIDHNFEYSGNGNYPIGFLLSWYLDETFGDYTKWILEYEKSNPYYESTAKLQTGELPKEEQIAAFKSVYGEDVFDSFYAWLKQNQSILSYQTIDLSEAEYIQLYPQFTSSNICYYLHLGDHLSPLAYKDLYIDFSAGKQYMTEYKGRNTDGMMLTFRCTEEIPVEFYDADGNLVKVKTTWDLCDESETSFTICEPIDGISFVKLVGEGSIYDISVIGFDAEYH